MRPQAYLDVAEELARTGGAARLRSAVSRAYYAVYHLATQATAELGGPARSSSHDVIGDRYLVSQDPDVSALGQRFLNLKAARHRADYKLADGADVDEPVSVAALMHEARELAGAFADLPRGALREAAAGAVVAYERMYRRR